MAPKPNKNKRDTPLTKDVKSQKKPTDYNDEYIIGEDELDQYFAEYGEEIFAEKNKSSSDFVGESSLSSSR